MRTLFLSLLFGIGSVLAQVHGQGSCDLDSGFKDSKDPGALSMLDRLKGTLAMGGNNVCSGALVTFKGRRSSAQALVLSAAHCADRGSVQPFDEGKAERRAASGERQDPNAGC